MSQTMEHVDSGSLHEGDGPDKKPKSRRPANTAFRQQRLKAWQPILTPKTVLPLFFAIGVIFAPIGGALLYASAKVQEISIDYSDCNTTAPICPAKSEIPSGKVHTAFRTTTDSADAPTWCRGHTDVSYGLGDYTLRTPTCHLQFEVPNKLTAPVLLYYQLTNFYQNHRRYVDSYDESQLKGTYTDNSSVKNGECTPLTVNEEGKAYYPCGLIANSIFNDTIKLPVLLNTVGTGGQNQTYNMTTNGIAWASDKDLYGSSPYTYDQVVPPPDWRKRYPDGYSADFPFKDLHTDEAFQVWMRTAGLPTFSKLALRNDDEDMESGRYEVVIYDDFPVLKYQGTKSILLSTRTVIGGKNPFLGIAYIVVGGICILLGALFTVAQLIRPRRLGDHQYLSWNTEQPSTGATTAR